MDFRGKRIHRGDVMVVALNAANHDPEKFEEPERFDPLREKNPHLAFGMGIHFCLGAPLARLEGEIAISSLLSRFGNIRLAVDESELAWRPGMIVRGVKELPVSL